MEDVVAKALRKLRTKPLFILLHGPSLRSVFEESGDLLRHHDAAYATLNDICIAEDFAGRIGKEIGLWFHISIPTDMHDWSDFARVLNKDTCPLFVHLDALNDISHKLEQEERFFIKNMHKIVFLDHLRDTVFTRLGLKAGINSFTIILFYLHMLGARGPVFIFGFDGLIRENATPEEMYADGHSEKSYLHTDDFGVERTKYNLRVDMEDFNKNWPDIEKWLDRRGIPRPPIYNVSQVSRNETFEKITPEDIGPLIEKSADFKMTGYDLPLEDPGYPEPSLQNNALRYHGMMERLYAAHRFKLVEKHIGALNIQTQQTQAALTDLGKSLNDFSAQVGRFLNALTSSN